MCFPNEKLVVPDAECLKVQTLVQLKTALEVIDRLTQHLMLCHMGSKQERRSDVDKYFIDNTSVDVKWIEQEEDSRKGVASTAYDPGKHADEVDEVNVQAGVGSSRFEVQGKG